MINPLDTFDKSFRYGQATNVFNGIGSLGLSFSWLVQPKKCILLFTHQTLTIICIYVCIISIELCPITCYVQNRLSCSKINSIISSFTEGKLFSGCENTIQQCISVDEPCIETIDFATNQLEVTYDPTGYPDASNPYLYIFYRQGDSVRKFGVRFPTTTTPTLKWSYHQTDEVSESLSQTGNSWGFTVAAGGILTLVSADNVEYTFTSTELSDEDPNSVEIGFSGFPASTSNCYRIFDPNRIDVGKLGSCK